MVPAPTPVPTREHPSLGVPHHQPTGDAAVRTRPGTWQQSHRSGGRRKPLGEAPRAQAGGRTCRCRCPFQHRRHAPSRDSLRKGWPVLVLLEGPSKCGGLGGRQAAWGLVCAHAEGGSQTSSGDRGGVTPEASLARAKLKVWTGGGCLVGLFPDVKGAGGTPRGRGRDEEHRAQAKI